MLPEIFKLVIEVLDIDFKIDCTPFEPRPVFCMFTYVNDGRRCICSAITAAPVGPMAGLNDKSRLVKVFADLLKQSIFERTAMRDPKFKLFDRQS